MPKIQSNKALKYDPIKPQLEGIIELKIVKVQDHLEEQLTVITVQDQLITENGVQNLALRNKTLSFAEIDGLEQYLTSQLGELTGTYMEKRLQLLQAGLKYITQTDPNPIYFSSAEDWEPIIPDELPEEPTEGE